MYSVRATLVFLKNTISLYEMNNNNDDDDNNNNKHRFHSPGWALAS